MFIKATDRFNCTASAAAQNSIARQHHNIGSTDTDICEKYTTKHRRDCDNPFRQEPRGKQYCSKNTHSLVSSFSTCTESHRQRVTFLGTWSRLLYSHWLPPTSLLTHGCRSTSPMSKLAMSSGRVPSKRIVLAVSAECGEEEPGGGSRRREKRWKIL